MHRGAAHGHSYNSSNGPDDKSHPTVSVQEASQAPQTPPRVQQLQAPKDTEGEIRPQQMSYRTGEAPSQLQNPVNLEQLFLFYRMANASHEIRATLAKLERQQAVWQEQQENSFKVLSDTEKHLVLQHLQAHESEHPTSTRPVFINASLPSISDIISPPALLHATSPLTSVKDSRKQNKRTGWEWNVYTITFVVTSGVLLSALIMVMISKDCFQGQPSWDTWDLTTTLFSA